MVHHWNYLKYVVRHKWFVFIAGIRIGVPIWRLIIHDWSKFGRTEWTPYVHSFHTYKGNRTPEVRLAFNSAWLHHQNHNPHHWQYWVIRDDFYDTELVRVRVLEMPEHFTREMVADWAGAGRGITGTWDFKQFYFNNEYKMYLHQNTRDLVVKLLIQLDEKFN